MQTRYYRDLQSAAESLYLLLELVLFVCPVAFCDHACEWPTLLQQTSYPDCTMPRSVLQGSQMVHILFRRKSVTCATSKRLKPHSASSQFSIIAIQLSYNVALDLTKQVPAIRGQVIGVILRASGSRLGAQQRFINNSSLRNHPYDSVNRQKCTTNRASIAS